MNMAPTNPTEGQRGGSRQGAFNRPNNNFYRRREHVSDRSSVPERDPNNRPYLDNGETRDAANNGCSTDGGRTAKSHRDKGGGRGSGARRKGQSNTSQKNTQRSNETGRDRVYSECSDEHCAVCLNRMQIYAVGMCNHPVCSECSTRMRILCAQNECPICRQDMPKVKQI